MKFKFLFVSLVLIGFSFAQQSPNWIWNSMNWGGVNPSQHGLNQYAEVAMGFKRQWMGFQGAPTTMNGTISLPFNDRKSDDAMFGVGLNTLVEKTGPFTFANATIEGAVNIQTNNEDRISLGIGFGLIQVGYDPSSVTTNLQDLIITRFSSNSYPLLKVGMSYKTKNALLGVYVNDLVPSTWNEVGENSSLRTEWGLYYRYFITLNQDWFLLPTVKVSEVFYSPVNYEILLRLNYNYRFHIWLGTHNLNALHLGLGIRIKEVFTLNYLFENYPSVLKSVSLNSHSIGIKYILNKQGAINKKQQLLFD